MRLGVRSLVAIASILAGISGCRAIVEPDTLENNIGVIVSAPVRSGAATTAAPGRAPAAAAAGQLVVYVSLPPGSVPTGMLATITDQATGLSTTTAVVNGGFDPVPIAASVGDTLVTEIVDLTSVVLDQVRLAVALARPLKVVRTSPPSGGRDVPLNAFMVVVFSEPIDPAGLSGGSIELLQDTTPVAGTFRFGDASQLRVEFHPASLLASETTYRLQVSTAISGVNGAALDSPLDVLFTTGANGPVTGLTFASVTEGDYYTCGVTTTGAAYCWGGLRFGPLNSPMNGSPTPVAVPGGHRFASVSAGEQQVCGVTTDGAAYCWGNLGYGDLTLDPATLSACLSKFDCPTPVPVPGGLTFVSLSAGDMHRCGVTTSGAAYCWGEDPSAPDVTTPRPVPGGLTFATVSAGGGISCGVATTGDAYCWGNGQGGDLGDGTTTSSTVPVKVAGGLIFKMVSAALYHVCGVTTDGTAYCWGANYDGELGDGTTTNSAVPVKVAGGLVFATISTGWVSTCGVTTAGAAYCWGADFSAAVGFVGGHPPSATPVAIPGGLPFAMLSTGFVSHRCGVTTGGTAYCWGTNIDGELGDGTTTQSAVPVEVVGQP